MCALVTGVQTCALPICQFPRGRGSRRDGPDHAFARHVATQLVDESLLRQPVPGEQVQEQIAAETTGLILEGGSGANFFCHEVVRRHDRSEEHTSELQSLMRISYAVFCLQKKNNQYIK